MTGFDSKRSAAQDKLTDDADTLTIVYQQGFADGKRAAQPKQEPVAMRMPKVGDKVICLEDESLGKVVSLTAGGSPDITFDDGSRGTYLLSEFAELFGYVAPPAAQPEQKPVAWLPTAEWRDPPHAMIYFNPTASQRPWVGLEIEDKKKIATAAGCTDDDDGHIVTEIFRLAEAKLKERNT